MSALSNMVLIMFTKDTMVQPKESEVSSILMIDSHCLFELRLTDDDDRK